MEKGQNPEFLRKTYALHESAEVESATKRKELRTGEEVEKTPEAQIQNYLDRFQEILERKDPSERARGIEAIKRLLHRKFIVKPEVATDVYLKHQQRMAHERGHGKVEVPEGVKNKIGTAVEVTVKGGNLKQELQGFSDEEKQMAEEITAKIDEQKHTLDYWIDYLSGPDALYPDWLKYWAIRSVTELSSYDKDEKEFPKRRPDTINPFPDLNQQALATVLDEVTKNEVYRAKLQELKDRLKPKETLREKKEKQQRIAERITALKEQDSEAEIDRKAIVQEVEEELGRTSFTEQEEVQALRAEREHVDESLQTFLDSAEFAKLYAQELEKLSPIDESMLANTNGKWVKYDQGSDHMVLAKSLQPYNTGWCTAGENTAESQLSRGDFYVYYSEDEDGNFVIPRSAIRMEGDKIAEVRGTAKDQNTDRYINPVVKEKMREFPDGPLYMKKSDDMDRMTEIEKKAKIGTRLTKSEIVFLYEIDSKIEGFGNRRDDRIWETLGSRDKEADFESLFPMLVALREKSERREVCTTEELQYLYEVRQEIKLGSFDRSNVTDIIRLRNAEADMPVVFGCETEPDQIATSIDHINELTKAYVGPLVPEIFKRIADYNVEYVYTQFPEKRIRRIPQEAGGRTVADIKSRIASSGSQFGGEGEFMVDSDDFKRSIYTDETFTTLKPRETHQLIRLTVADLGFSNGATTKEIFDRAIALGLDFCPPEVGSEYRISYTDQPMGEWVRIGMKQIKGSYGLSYIFGVVRGGDGSWLSGDWAGPVSLWDAGNQCVFSIRKSDS